MKSSSKRKQMLEMCRRNRVWKQAAAVCAVTLATAVLVFFLDLRNCSPVMENGKFCLERNDYGDGSRTETLTVESETYGKTLVEVEIDEREYDADKIQEILEREAEELEKQILGENESLESVREDLNFISRIPDTGIDVTWELSNYEVMDITGKINRENLTDDGMLVEITAVLTYREQILRHTFPACVYPRQLDGKEKFLARLSEAVKQLEEGSRSQKQLVLPAELDGEKLTWKRNREQRWVIVLMLGLTTAALLLAREREQEQKKEKERKKQMMLDYPEIVNKFTIYTGAGMTVRNAWGRIVRDYEENQRKEKVRYAYEEMRITMHEMEEGEGERDCYERFGNRCRLQPYLKLGALLTQNLRKGSKGLSELLRIEARNAFEERKTLARRQGEEAGTKLLVPMFLMLAVVLVIVIVPALLSVQI